MVHDVKDFHDTTRAKHNSTVLLIWRKIMMHEEERQGKEVYNR